MDQEPYLELSKDPVRFEAVSQLTNVFFDDSSKQVITVRSGGVMGVVVKGLEKDSVITFWMEDLGPVISIKFSPDQKILAVQRSYHSVEFRNFSTASSSDQEYSQACKKNAMLHGFIWTQNNQIAFITDRGIEFFMITPEKRVLKSLKVLSMPVQWFVWCSSNKIAILASANGSQLQPVQFKPNVVAKLPKLELPGRMITERDVTLANIYDKPAVLIMQHMGNVQGAEISVYFFTGPGSCAVKTDVLCLDLSGRFAVNIVDNLIIVHHQLSKTSTIFDVALPGESDGVVTYHKLAASPRTMRPFSLPLPGLEPTNHNCELYSLNWVVFQPNIIIDAKLGCLWLLELCLEPLCRQMRNQSMAAKLLLNRTDAKPVLLQLLRETVSLAKPPLAVLDEQFEHINSYYHMWLESKMQSQLGTPVGTTYKQPPPCPKIRVLIDQIEMHDQVFQQPEIESHPRLDAVLLLYIKSLAAHSIIVQNQLSSMLITNLVRKKKFFALHQLLQYGVVADSKATACLLLSLGSLHRAAGQLAMDMLSRIRAAEELQEVLLSEGHVVAAIRLSGKGLQARKFLHAAEATDDLVAFHSVLHYFRTHPSHAHQFADGRLDAYVKSYDRMVKPT